MNRKDHGILRAHQACLSILQRAVDLLIIIAAMVGIERLTHETQGEAHFMAILLALACYLLISDLGQLYASWRGEHVSEELSKVIAIWSLSFIAVLLWELLQTSISRSMLFQWYGLVLAGLIFYRVMLRAALHKLRRLGFNSKSIAIVGAGALGVRLASRVASAPWIGLNLEEFGFYDDARDCPVQVPGVPVPLKLSGNLDKLVEHARIGKIDRIYITLPLGSEERVRWLVDRLSDTTASVYMVPDVFIFNLLNSRVHNIGGVPAISIFDSPMMGVAALVKRLEDIILSSLILCMIAIPMLAIAGAIKINSPGPVFFRQKRYGIDGREIEVWKFRSMQVMENGERIVQATRNDSRITRIGAVLRRTSLDELPQFINVLLGSMSIVGPRPHAIAHNEEYRSQISSYMLRHKVKPGITGWAQVNGWRGETDTLEKMRKRVEHDLIYIHNWSLWWDLKIIFFTILRGFTHKNAY